MRGLVTRAPTSLPLRHHAVAYDGARAAHRALQRRNINHKTLACGETLTAFLTDLRLDDFQPLLQRLPAGTFEGASGPPMGSRDLRRFLVSVARAASGNSQLLEMLGDCKDRLATPSDEEVHRIVHYCLCLHLITRELAASPELARAVLDHQQRALRSQSDWWKYLSAFEHAKLITLERALIFFSYHRAPSGAAEHLPIPANFGRIGLPFNIFEAVLQDALFYRTGTTPASNAWAGVPLILARPGRAGKPAALSDDSRRAVRMHLPLAQKWKDLYIAWNVAFTSNYQDAPYFAAALLCPCILGASPDEFMFHRTFALHLHASAQIRARSRLGIPPGGRVQSERDWAAACRKANLIDTWGDRNLKAAHEYFAEVAPQLNWVSQPWHEKIAEPLIARQAAALELEEGSYAGVVTPTRGLGRAPPPEPLPLAGEDLEPGQVPPWRRLALAANVFTLGAALTAVAPLTLILFAPALAEAAGAAASAGI